MDNNAIKEVYLKRKSYNALEVDDNDIQWQFILRYIPTEHSIPVLDAGCGNGKYALKLFKQGYSAISAVDLFDTIPVKEISYQKASITDLPFPDKTFQFIYANSVIYYPTNTQSAIQEFARVIKPNGLILLTAHTKYSLFTLKRILLRFFGSKKAFHLKDVRFKSAREYTVLLRQSGFEIERTDGFMLSFFVVPVYLYFRLLVLKYLNINLPPVREFISRSRLTGRIKSIIGYHMVIVARRQIT